MDPDTKETYYAQIGALTVLGKIGDHDLNYHCPPAGYNGVGPGCKTKPHTQLAVLHVNALNNKLYAMDIILSGAPFPATQGLKNNKPPFGTARHKFTSGIKIKNTGHFKICAGKKSNKCPNKNPNAHKLPHPLPSNYGHGIFAVKGSHLVTTSTWIMDDANQLLIVSAGNTSYYFNGTGFFMYDAGSKTCTWSATCDYQCEVYNYDSRFLDYVGEWVITKKWGIARMKPVAVKVWIGNAIDAAGIFPIIMYTDKKTGDYLGLDKLDPIPSPKMGAVYWYTKHGKTKPKVTIKNYHPTLVEVGCIGNMRDWIGGVGTKKNA
ncbi:unnamed protein product [Didymodactylos carnosus]|uniref:Uncharacterized protein n=1 Tax=Didymodactylos carnosus TaxID=1234261 RepID=A0A814TPH8_9BILA|nr:unnamed protein product [Didymodactylos carnosus]CAF1376784.1 unnamed protein product [Didymodactylos carnosus]CAF3927823.1 unnamed protein product [Didymodactylos carnosus]CAF4185553.1 unnamed protein product [Didymodactylos carnosus]